MAKNRYAPADPCFFYIKVGFKGVYISRACFPDGRVILDSHGHMETGPQFNVSPETSDPVTKPKLKRLQKP